MAENKSTDQTVQMSSLVWAWVVCIGIIMQVFLYQGSNII